MASQRDTTIQGSNQQLQAKIAADPRIQAIVQRHRAQPASGSGIGTLSAAQLREFGYDVPEGYTFSFGARMGAGYLSDGKDDFMERWGPKIAIGMGAVAGAGAAGVIPGIAGLGGGGAGGSLASAGAVGSAPGYVPSSMIGTGLGGAGTGAMSAADFLGDKPGLGGRIANGARNAFNGAADGGMSWWQQAALAGLSGVPALVAASQNKPSAEELALQQQIKDSLASQQRRYDHQSPLFSAVTQLAMSRLPTASQRPLNPLEEG